MTYTLEQITNYVDGCIADMTRHLEHAKGNDGGPITEWTAEHKYNWAVGCIEADRERGFGALVFTEVYLKGIEEKQYKKLNDRLSDAYFEAKEKARDEILYK